MEGAFISGLLVSLLSQISRTGTANIVTIITAGTNCVVPDDSIDLGSVEVRSF